jgi:hypothetical protein
MIPMPSEYPAGRRADLFRSPRCPARQEERT